MTVRVTDEELIRIEISHYGRSWDTTRLIQSFTRMKAGVVYITSSWEPELDGLNDCPMSAIDLWLPREIARGYTEEKLVWSDSYGNGAGGYLPAVPVLKENRPILSIKTNLTDPASWMVPLAHDVDVSLPADLAFAALEIWSNGGDVRVDGFYGDKVELTVVGGDIIASNLQCSALKAEAVAAHTYRQDFWNVTAFMGLPSTPVLYMWPSIHRAIGTVQLAEVYECETPCSGWYPQSKVRSATAEALALVVARYSWLVMDVDWLASSYSDRDPAWVDTSLPGADRHRHAAASLLYSSGVWSGAWNGRFYTPFMWLAVDMKKEYTVGAVKLTGYAAGGVPSRFLLQVRPGPTGSYDDVMTFPCKPEKVGDEELGEVVDGFEVSGRCFRLVFDETAVSRVDDGVADAAGSHARLSADVLLSVRPWAELGGWAAEARPWFDASGGGFDRAGGRYTADIGTGLYFCAASLEVTAVAAGGVFEGGVFEALVAINGLVGTETGLHTTRELPAEAAATLGLRGLMRLRTGDFVSVWTVAEPGLQYTYGLHTGLGCVLAGGEQEPAGFAAVLGTDGEVVAHRLYNVTGNRTADFPAGLGWSELVGWDTHGLDGPGSLFLLGGGFDSATGRFTAAAGGVHLVTAQMLLTEADSGYFAVAVALGRPGLHPPDPAGIWTARAVGVVQPGRRAAASVTRAMDLLPGEYVSAWVLAQDDQSFVLGRGTAFSAVLLPDVAVGFAASLEVSGVGGRSRERAVIPLAHGDGWMELGGWICRMSASTGWQVADGMFERSELVEEDSNEVLDSFDEQTGRYTAPTTGLYLVGALVAGAGGEPLATMVAINADTQLPSTLRCSEPQSSLWGASCGVAGAVQLEAGETLSLWAGATSAVEGGTFSVLLLRPAPTEFDELGSWESIDDATWIDGGFAAIRQTPNPRREVGGWGTAGVSSRQWFFEFGQVMGVPAFDGRAGRFTAAQDGPYLVSVKLLLVGADYAAYELSVGINSAVPDSLGVIGARAAGNSGEHPLPLAANGLLDLTRNEYLSVWVHASADLSYSYAADSTFSVLAVPGLGVQAAAAKTGSLAERSIGSTGWVEIRAWTAGYGDADPPGVFNRGGKFIASAGRLTGAGVQIFLVAANVGLEGCVNGSFGVKLVLSSLTDVDTGVELHKPPTAAGRVDFALTGIVSIQSDEVLSVWVHSTEQADYKVGSTGGLSVMLLSSASGFAAGKVADLELTTTDWSEVGGWETDTPGTPFFEAGPVGFDPSTGRYTAHGRYTTAGVALADGPRTSDSVYFASASLNYLGGTSIIRRTKLAVNAELDLPTGLHSTSTGLLEPHGGCDALSGVLLLAPGDFVSLWVQQQVSGQGSGPAAPTTLIGAASGFQVADLQVGGTAALFGEPDGVSADLADAVNGWRELDGWNTNSNAGSAGLFASLEPRGGPSGARFYAATAGVHLVAASVQVSAQRFCRVPTASLHTSNCAF